MPSSRAVEALIHNPRLARLGHDELNLLDLVDLLELLTDRDLPGKLGGPDREAPVTDEAPAIVFKDMHTTTEAELFGHGHTHDHHDHVAEAETLPYDFGMVNDAADARPTHAGGGKSTDTDGGATAPKGKGGGKVKDTGGDGTTDGGATDGGTDGGATDGGATDGGATDGGATDGGATDGSGSTGTGEINPGSTDPNVYVTGMDDPGGYNIEIEFFGEWSDEERAAAIAAGELLSDLVTMDVVSYNGIDDIRIQAYNEPIDGVGGAVAQGGWIQLRDDAMKLVAEGGIRIDSADSDNLLATGKLQDAIMHEMLHAMGFGTTWAYTGLTEEINGVTRFVGENAIDAYNTEFAGVAGTDSDSHLGVPLSGDDAHWSQKSFGSEVMSPQLGADEFLSSMTLAALEDMGYETVYPDDPAEKEEVLFF